MTYATLLQKAGDRGSLARTSGGYAIVVAHNPDAGVTRIKLPSGSKKVLPRHSSWQLCMPNSKMHVKLEGVGMECARSRLGSCTACHIRVLAACHL